jgi:tetratricopeptide (TPR) repeat protein
MRSFRLFWLFLGLALLLSFQATAQNPNPNDSAAQKLEQERRKLAQKVFTDAEAAYKKEKYEEALAGYDQAYALTQEPLLLYNQAQCYRQLKKHQEALNKYQFFLEQAPDNTTYAPKAKKWMAEIEKESGLKAESPKPVSVVTPEPIGDPSLPMPKGPKENPIPESQPISSVINDQPTNKALEVKPAGTKEKTNKQAATRLLGIGGGLGVLAAGAGVTAFVVGSKSKNSQEQSFSETEAQEKANEISQQRKLAIGLGVAADVSFIGAALLAGKGLVILLKGPSEVAVSVSSTGVQAQIKF